MARRTSGFQSELQKAEDRRTRQTSNNVLAVLLFMLACGIIAALVWMNLPSNHGRTFVLFVYRENKSTHPVIGSDISRIEQAMKFFTIKPVNWRSVKIETDNFSEVFSEVNKEIGDNDHLVVYLAMPGLVRWEDNQQPKAFLDSGVGGFANQERSATAVDEVLKSIYEVKSKSRLIVFDPGQATVSLSSIMEQYFSNEVSKSKHLPQEKLFPLLLNQAILTTKAPERTWAIIAHRSFEQSLFLESLGHSILAEAFSKAWQKSGPEVDVIDLYQNMLLECRRLTWWDAPDGSSQKDFGQIPVLIDVSREKTIEFASLDKSSGGSDHMIAYVGDRPESKTTDAASGKPPATESVQPGETNPFPELWGLVKELERRDDSKLHSPIDFAPEQWAQFLEKLVRSHVAFVAKGQVNSNGNGNPKQWINELQWIGNDLTATPDKEDGPRRDIKELVDIARLLKDYTKEWIQNQPDTSSVIGDENSLKKKALAAGKIRDALFRSRFYFQGFDLEPDYFPDTKSLARWINELPDSRSFSDKEFLQDEVLIAPEIPRWNWTKKVELKSQPSPWIYERDLEIYLLTSYLKQEKPESYPAYTPNTGEGDLEAGQFAALSPQESPGLNERWFKRNLLPLIDSASDVWSAGSSLAVPEAEILRSEAAKLAQCVIKSRPGIGVEPPEMVQRRELVWAESILSKSIEKYVPPKINWKSRQASFQVAIAASPESKSFVKESGDNEVTVRPPAEFAPVKLELSSSVEVINQGDLEWSISPLEPGGRDYKYEIEQPDHWKGTGRRLLTITPKVNNNTTPTTRLTLQIRDASQKAEPQTRSIKINVEFPKPDQFDIAIANKTWKSTGTPNSPEPLLDLLTAISRENRLLIEPVTGVPTRFQFKLFNQTELDQLVRAELYRFQPNAINPGRVPESFNVSDFDELVDARELTLLKKSKETTLKPRGETDLEWEDEPKTGEPLRAALLLRVETGSKDGPLPLRHWYKVIDLERILARRTIRSNTDSSNTIKFTPSEDLDPFAFNLPTFQLKMSDPELPFTVLADRNGEKEWNVKRDNSQTGTDLGLVLLDLPGEPRALRYEFNSAQKAVWITRTRVEFELKDSKSLEGVFESYTVQKDNLPIQVWLIKDAGEWDDEQRGKHPLRLKLDLPDGVSKNPWTLDQSGDSKPISMMDRNIDFTWSTERQDLIITPNATDFEWKLPEGKTNLSYEVKFEDKTAARLMVIRTPPEGALNRPTLNLPNSILLAEKDRLEIKVQSPQPNQDTHLIGTLSVYWNNEEPPILVKPVRPGDDHEEWITVEKEKFKDKLAKVGKYSVKAVFTDFFGRKSDPHELTLVVSEPKKDVKQEKLHRLTINMSLAGPGRIQSITLSGVEVKRKEKEATKTIAGKQVAIAEDLANKSISFSGLPAGEYEVSAVFEDGTSGEYQSAPAKIKLNATMEFEYALTKKNDK